MRISLAATSPIPLYHQIVEAIRYRIATGAISAGSKLPTLREAAELWNVNLHTVRHAYTELAKQGFVTTRGPAGTEVLDIGESGPRDQVDNESITRFTERVVHEAHTELGLSVSDLMTRLGAMADRPNPASVITVTECTLHQSQELSQQFETRFDVTAHPWCFADEGEAPAGTIVGTYFHYNELRARWPERRADLRFVVIAPDASVAHRIRALQGRDGLTSIALCELDDDMAHNIAADLTVLLPADDYQIQPVVVAKPGDAFDRVKSDVPILFSPRTWGLLTPEQRQWESAYELTYRVDRDDASRLAREFNWRQK